MKLQTHQCTLVPVFMIFSKHVVSRRYYAKILVTKHKIIRKRYESIVGSALHVGVYQKGIVTVGKYSRDTCVGMYWKDTL